MCASAWQACKEMRTSKDNSLQLSEGLGMFRVGLHASQHCLGTDDQWVGALDLGEVRRVLIHQLVPEVALCWPYNKQLKAAQSCFRLQQSF